MSHFPFAVRSRVAAAVLARGLGAHSRDTQRHQGLVAQHAARGTG